jgi:hypothetical protein
MQRLPFLDNLAKAKRKEEILRRYTKAALVLTRQWVNKAHAECGLLIAQLEEKP